MQIETWWLYRLINKSHLFMAGLSKLLLGIVNITMIPFGKWGQVKDGKRRLPLFSGDFCNPFTDKLT